MEAVRWALEPVGSPVQLEVLDLAAGTGKLTGVLLGEGHRVTAVEPDEGMLSELVRRCRGVRALPGSAERIPLTDGEVDAVLVGQAFHWFDPERALPEIARVLRPGGVLAGLWNEEDGGVPWVAEVKRRAETSASGTDAPSAPAEWMVVDEHFTAEETALFPHSFRRTAETLAETLGTYSQALVVSERERAEARRRTTDFLLSREETREGEFDVPLLTHVKRQIRV
nr:class I SAM-dependent methyltransferase [Umezawaea beigongshangensis]